AIELQKLPALDPQQEAMCRILGNPLHAGKWKTDFVYGKPSAAERFFDLLWGKDNYAAKPGLTPPRFVCSGRTSIEGCVRDLVGARDTYHRVVVDTMRKLAADDEAMRELVSSYKRQA